MQSTTYYLLWLYPSYYQVIFINLSLSLLLILLMLGLTPNYIYHSLKLIMLLYVYGLSLAGWLSTLALTNQLGPLRKTLNQKLNICLNLKRLDLATNQKTTNLLLYLGRFYCLVSTDNHIFVLWRDQITSKLLSQLILGQLETSRI